MKKSLILFLFLCFFSAVYSQDSVLVKEFQKLTLTNDSLQKQVKKLTSTNDSLQKQIKKIEKDNGDLNIKINNLSKDKIKNEIDSLRKANDSLQKQVIKPKQDSISNLQGQIKKIEKDNGDLNIKIKNLDSKINDLNKDKLKIEKDSLQKYNKNLIEEKIKFEKKIYEQEKDIASMKNESLKQQNAYNQIAQTYNKPFNELIKSLTKQTVERDLLFIGNNETVKKKIQDLQKYFVSRQVLEERYNDEKIKTAQNQLKSVEQSELVKDLIDKLVDYKLRNEGLKTTINNILEIDKKFVSNDEYTQKTKLQDILFEFSWYFRNYRFNFDDYPYLSSIVLEIMKVKQKDANTPIKYLLDRL